MYLEMVDGLGKVAIEVRLIHADEQSAPVIYFTLNIDFQDPSVVDTKLFHMPNLHFERAGPYRLQAWTKDKVGRDDELILNKVLQVRVVE